MANMRTFKKLSPADQVKKKYWRLRKTGIAFPIFKNKQWNIYACCRGDIFTDTIPESIHFYILKGREVIRTRSLTEWTRYQAIKTRVGINFLMFEGREVTISTVFLGVPMGKCFFETAIIGVGVCHIADRYETYQEAEEGHARIVKQLKEQYSIQ